MKLSETGITLGQMSEMARSVGVTWMGRTFDRTTGDGELSNSLSQAIEAHGTSDLRATFTAANQIQTAASLTSETADRAKLGKLLWYGESVWVNGVADRRLDRRTVARRMETLGLVTTGDTFHGSAAVVPDEVIESVRQEFAEVVTRVDRAMNAAPARVQLWEPCEQCGVEPSYQTASGHLCAIHAKK